ncbi:MAG TPA: aspartate carbamoyltransferase [Methanoculleus sp.]|jgi:aspartate carbamoyltransferase catalytic subunit|nr:aspartate carbamoyltransferase catalytic subunit [Methanomicrobiaceae archaeon]HOD86586.1 aspartate carbamoyltransferase [Methanoculleus sp.]MDK2863740.1 aspartate carbamoyltransferase catalytic subunit [Methanomicrobiaceae archaeon]HPZ32349.1 aspartate carbamoyltransferase [Methanoculleus sp.]HQN91729.1 aspartate carbamoyltransferase [Methanoculleus sp.]
MYHIISIRDFEREDLDYLLDRAEVFETGRYPPGLLKDRLVALLFFEPSTRTRMSFAAALARLGGQSISVDSVEASSIVKGETLADTIRVVSGYVDAIVLRHPKEGAARLAAEFSSVPVINAGDGAGQHPSQTLLDLYTIRKSMPLDGIDAGLLGDLRYGRTAHSLALALSLYGVTLHTIAPTGLEMPVNIAVELRERGVEVVEHASVEEAIRELDVLYVTRIQRERFPDTASYYNVASSYRITTQLLEGVRDHLMILHPLPRAGEIDPAVDRTPYARYFEQARNGVPVRMALLHEVMR